ncbi:diguanylate cyclase [Bifidobacterium animalis subsp. lactis ATCC 27673]|nr:diguanylate cyclase [Bifidobacterium animalis subsp. lactis ATCC 27673]
MVCMAYVSQNGLHDSINKATTDLFTFAYKHVIKPDLVFNHTPDIAHDQMIRFCQITGKMPPLMWLCRTMLNYTDPILETNVMGINFANPFGLSAGLDKNCDMAAVLDHAGFGFETVGSTTSRPCAGNPRPWFHRLPEYDSMMVHVGLANDGSDVVIERAEDAWRRTQSMQLSVSIARTNDDQVGDLNEGIEDYCISMERAAGRTAMVEVNVSCPNTTVGEPFTESAENLDKLFAALDRIERPQPTLVKMPLNKPWPQFKEFLDVLAAHNVQGVTIANLQKDRTGLDDIPKDWLGGLSGGPCTVASTELIRRTYAEYGDRFAIAGVGGVFTPEQAYEKIRAGSSLIMFISSLMYRGQHC